MSDCAGPREWLFQTDPTTTDRMVDQTSLWMAICTDCVDDARDSFPNGHLVGHIDEFADRVIDHVFIDARKTIFVEKSDD